MKSVGGEHNDWNQQPDDQQPAPGPPRSHESEEHRRYQYDQCSQQRITNRDMCDTGEDATFTTAIR